MRSKGEKRYLCVFSIYKLCNRRHAKEFEGIDLLAKRTLWLKRQHEQYIDYIISTMRKRIETTFSGIANFFPKKIHAVTGYGFILKVVIFIFGYAISRTII